MVWAEYGYSANIRMSDFLAAGTMFATHHGGERLTADHGFPSASSSRTCTRGRA